MTEKDITQVRIGQYGFGIIGIKRLMEELAETYTDKSDAEVKAVMVERLSKDNYIPTNVREDYGKAFVREFRKFLGSPTRKRPRKGWTSRCWVLGAINAAAWNRPLWKCSRNFSWRQALSM